MRIGSLLLIASLLMAGCKDRSLRQRTEQIREYSDREDRTFRAEAVARIERAYWTVHNHAWYGKLPNGGGILRLRAPQVIPAPLPSAVFYRGWHLQLTVAADDWRAWPASGHPSPYVVVYAITRYNVNDWNIRVEAGPVTSPLRHEDAASIPPDEM